MPIDINLALRVWEKTIDYLTLLHNTIPADEHLKMQQRWGKLWDAIWRDQPKPPTEPPS